MSTPAFHALFQDRNPEQAGEGDRPDARSTMARNAYGQAAARWPDRLIMLCQGGRILERSDAPLR